MGGSLSLDLMKGWRKCVAGGVGVTVLPTPNSKRLPMPFLFDPFLLSIRLHDNIPPKVVRPQSFPYSRSYWGSCIKERLEHAPVFSGRKASEALEEAVEKRVVLVTNRRSDLLGVHVGGFE